MKKHYEIQKLLKEKGFDPGPIDGILGVKTELAILKALRELKTEKLDWLKVAKSYLGLEEIKGKFHNPEILEFWKLIGLPFDDDETPWCAGFVGGVLEKSGIESSKSALARSYMNWGVELQGPVVGAIVTFWRSTRNSWSGHVGFIVGKDQNGELMVLGGNQGNQVSIKPFDTDRVLSYSWPEGQPKPKRIGFRYLPIVNSDGKLSTNEQ